MKLEFLIIYNLLPVCSSKTYCLCFKFFNYFFFFFFTTFFHVTQLFHYFFPRNPDKRKKKEKPKATIVDCEAGVQWLYETATIVDKSTVTVWDSYNCWLRGCYYAPSLFFSISVSTAFSILYLLFIYLFLFWVSLQVKLSTPLDSKFQMNL